TALCEAANVSLMQAKAVFRLLFLFVHGYASMYANNSLKYDEDIIGADLQRIFAGAMYELREDL
ncbi:MAG: TetR/AcrR family transcriptional regulator, partial [Acetatifactor sp.]|nr:TetR/AcrR family transcriptional regulator [Acetatifactor sp.]